MGLAAAAALLVAGTAAAAPLIDRYGGGGTLHSPDGRWTIHAPRLSQAANDRLDVAPAYLSGPGVRHRHLLDYDRLMKARWPRDGRHVLLNLIDINYQVLDVRTLGPRETGHPDRINVRIAADMGRVRPLLNQVDRQALGFGRIGGASCVLVEQDGTPLGRREGSFITRRAAYRLDLDAERPVRIARCPGARKDLRG